MSSWPPAGWPRFDQLLPSLAGRQPLGRWRSPAGQRDPEQSGGRRRRRRCWPATGFGCGSRSGASNGPTCWPSCSPTPSGRRSSRSTSPAPASSDDSFADPDVAALVVFGSDDWMLGYRELARSTGTKVVFEGPGKDPFLVLPGADLRPRRRRRPRSAAPTTPARPAPRRSGSTSPNRSHDEFVDALAEAAESAAGRRAHRSRDTWVGPLTETGAAQVRGQLEQAVAAGRRGADRRPVLATPAPPTVVVRADHRMDLMRAETFGRCCRWPRSPRSNRR